MPHLKIIFALTILLSNCKNKNKFLGSKRDITSTVMDWLKYENTYIEWHNDYKTYNTSNQEIPRLEFLKELTNGKKIPIRLNNHKEQELILQDLDISKKNEEEIGKAVAVTAHYLFKLASLENKFLPEINWNTITGEKFKLGDLANDTIILNAWFLKCDPCIKEIPYLNELKVTYSGRPNVKFLALSFDKTEAIIEFLEKTQFMYTQIADQEDFLRIELGIESYPTHLIIIKNRIIKAVSKPKQLTDKLKQLFKE